MSVPLLLLLALPAAPVAGPSAEPQPRILVLELDAHGGADEGQVHTLSSLTVAEVGNATGLEVVDGGDLRKMIELESEKLAAGCDPGTASCMAEIAGALNAELVVYGEVGAVGSLLVLTLNLFDARAASVLAKETARGKSFDDLVAALPDVVHQLVSSAGVTPATTAGNTEAASPAPEQATSDGGFSPALVATPFVIAGGGGLLVVAGAAAAAFGGAVYALYGQAFMAYTSATTPAAEASAKADAERYAALYNPWGQISIPVGLAAAAVGALVVVIGAAAGTTLLVIDDE